MRLDFDRLDDDCRYYEREAIYSLLDCGEFDEAEPVDEEIAINKYGKCPRCGSRRIDQVDYDSGFGFEWYHCADCGAWYNEHGELDVEDEEDEESEYD